MKYNSSVVKGILLITTGALLIWGCRKDVVDPTTPKPKTGPDSNEVWIQNFAFNPSTITVKVNTTIKWTKKDADDHTATSTNGKFNTGTIHKDQSASYTFTAAGSYPYICAFHPLMTGTIVVQ